MAARPCCGVGGGGGGKSGVTRREAGGAAAAAAAAAVLSGASPAAAAERMAGDMAAVERSPTLLALESRVSTFALPNGMRFVVCERHQAPIFSVQMYADVGAYDEREGETGVAHLLEHLAFKGTQTLGTTDFAAERLALDDCDAAFYALRDAVAQGAPAGRVGELREALARTEAAAAVYELPNAYGATLKREGGVGLNAETSFDSTVFYCSLPSNKLELWFALESDRLRAPVFRGMYAEKGVIEEERRLRVDNSPQGKFQQAFLEAAFDSPYRRPIIGYEHDFDQLGREEVCDFFQRKYGPGAMTVAIAGDITPEQVQRLAEEYFGSWEPNPAFEPPSAAAPARTPSPRTVRRSPAEISMAAPASPLLYMGYERGSRTSPDAIPISLFASLLSNGRTSPFYTDLVEPRRALAAALTPTFPGEKHGTMSLLIGLPVEGQSIGKLRSELVREVDMVLKPRAPRALENGLARAKRQSRAARRRALASNSACAGALASSEALGSDLGWRELVERAERSEATTPGEVRDVCRRVFAESNLRAVGSMTREA
eukprot:PRCOL_00000332-RA